MGFMPHQSDRKLANSASIVNVSQDKHELHVQVELKFCASSAVRISDSPLIPGVFLRQQPCKEVHA